MRNSPLRRNLLTMISLVSLASMTALLNAGAVRADDRANDIDRLHNSGQVMKEIVDVPDNIPQALLDKSACVVVIPSVLKAAFVFGAMYGRGTMTCRTGEHFNGPWGAPTMMALEGGSFGFQIGAQATDFVLLVMNSRGASAILSSKVKLGGDASVAAGPVGRDAEADTDASMRAEVLNYSRSRGLFVGVSLEGSTLRPDNDANRRIYGEHLSAREIALHQEVAAPESAHLLLATLNEHSPHRS